MNALRWLAVTAVAVLAMAGCSPDRSGGDSDIAGAYARMIQWFVDRTEPAPDDEGERDPVVVFVEARGEGVNIGLTMQAAIIARAEPFATVRFIDDRAEALTDGDAPVQDEGLLLALGPAKEHGSKVVIECDEFVAADDERSWHFELQSAPGDEDDQSVWTLRGEPEPIEP